MKIIQSYWSKPSNANIVNERSSGGWYSRKYQLLSWALSCLTLRRFYNDLELITDRTGKQLLIDVMQLPYSRVSMELDGLSEYPTNFWSLGKLYAYSIQNKPFIHVDGDVYIWKKLETRVKRRNLIVQSKQYFKDYSFLSEFRNMIETSVLQLPDEIGMMWKKSDDLGWINAGVLGGEDVSFLRKYSARAIQFLEANLNIFSSTNNLNTQLINMLFEEHFFYCLAKAEKKKIQTIYSDVDTSFSQVMKFNLLPEIESYIHLAGVAKKSIYACEQVEFRLKNDFPEMHKKIIYNLHNAGLINEDNVGLTFLSYTGLKGGEINGNEYYPYERTNCLIESLGLNIPISGSDFMDNLVLLRHCKQIGSNEFDKISSVYLFEKLLAKKKPHESRYDSNQRFQRAKYYYETLLKSREAILDRVIVLEDGVEIVNCKWYLSSRMSSYLQGDNLISLSKDAVVFIYYHPFSGVIQELKLEGFDELLLSFKTPTAARKIIEHLFDNALVEECDRSILEYKITDLIGQHLLYSGILKMI